MLRDRDFELAQADRLPRPLSFIWRLSPSRLEEDEGNEENEEK